MRSLAAGLELIAGLDVVGEAPSLSSLLRVTLRRFSFLGTVTEIKEIISDTDDP